MAYSALKSTFEFSNSLPDADSLTNFFEQLRATQHRLNPRQLAAAYRILLTAHAETWSVSRLQFVLKILLAKTKQEQFDFIEQSDVWLGIRRTPTKNTGLGTSIANRGTPGVIWVLMAVMASFALPLAFKFYSIINAAGPSSEFNTGPPQGGLPPELEAAVDAMLPFVLRVSVIIPLAAFLLWIFLKRRRRTLWVEARARTEEGAIEFDQMEVPAALGHVFSGPALFEAARELRRHRPVPWIDLDIDRTVELTARQAGHFNPVWRQRVRRPEYIVLIEEGGRRDHVARILDAGLDALQKLGVWIQRYYYSGDPRIVVRDNPGRTPVSLTVLGEREQHKRLLIFGSGRGLVNPLTARISPRIREALQPWSDKTFLSTEPVQTWAEREQQLLRDGFSVGTASVDGLVSLAIRVAQGNAQSGGLLDGQLKMSQPGALSTTDTKNPILNVLTETRPHRKADEAHRWHESLAVENPFWYSAQFIIALAVTVAVGPYFIAVGYDLSQGRGLEAFVDQQFGYIWSWIVLNSAIYLLPIFVVFLARYISWLKFPVRQQIRIAIYAWIFLGALLISLVGATFVTLFQHGYPPNWTWDMLIEVVRRNTPWTIAPALTSVYINYYLDRQADPSEQDIDQRKKTIIRRMLLALAYAFGIALLSLVIITYQHFTEAIWPRAKTQVIAVGTTALVNLVLCLVAQFGLKIQNAPLKGSGDG